MRCGGRAREKKSYEGARRFVESVWKEFWEKGIVRPPASFEPKQVPFTGPLLEHRPNCRPRFRSKSPLLDPVVGEVLCAEDK